MDFARKWTDEKLEELERRITREYQRAAREMREKQRDFLAAYAKELEMREKALDGTKEALEAHKRWLASQAAHNAWMQEMVDELTKSAVRADEMAVAMMNDAMPVIYAENANMAAYAIDKAIGMDTAFSLVNEDVVRYLMGLGEHGALIPEVVSDGLINASVQSLRKDINSAKDIRWNRQHFTSAITQGILQGESIPNIVKRTESIFGRDRNAAIRAARTATTSAENAGRLYGFERAAALGIDLEIEWEATLDDRTRESHRELDGERIQVGETFSNGLRYPGDPAGDPSEVYNCRCRADGRVVGFDGERGEWADDEPPARWSRLPENITYDEWKKGVDLNDAVGDAIGEAKATEPAVSSILTAIAESQGFEFAGFEFRIKGEGSLKRKILGDLKTMPAKEAKLSYNEIVGSIHDNLRYTFLVEQSAFKGGYDAAVKALEDKGYSMVRVKNTMANEEGKYKGVNTLVKTDKGYIFELQFHTQESYEAKDAAHKFYEVERVSEPGSREWREAHEAGAEIFNAVPIPAGVDGIQSFNDLR